MSKAISKTTLSIYGATALPLALVGYPIAIWLPAFYASHIGLSLASVATMLLLAKITDVITDPLVGIVSDRLKTRIGRRRPIIILGVPVLMVSIWCLFVPPAHVSQWYLLICIAGMYIGTTLIGVPYGAWGAELSSDYHERSRITAWREQFTLIGLLVAAFIPFIVEQYIQPENEMSAIMKGMALAIAISAPITVALLCIFVKEPAGNKPGHINISFSDSSRRIWANVPMRMMIGLILIVVMAEAFRNALSLFFIKGVIEADGVGTLYFAYFVAGLLAVPFWLWLGQKIGKHIALSVVLITVAIISVINIGFGRDDYTLFVIFFIAKGACFGGLQFLPISILADVIDIETAETGKPRAGAYIAFASMTSKVSTALGTFLAIRALSLTNFDATKLADNPAEEILALRILYTIVPALFFLFAILIAWRFPLTAEKHGELQKKIAAHNN